MKTMRRVAALITAALLVFCGELAGGIGTARAADPGLSISIAGTYYIPTAASPPDRADSFIFTDHNADGSTPAESDVTIDASAFAGKVGLSDVEYGCGHTGLVSTCVLDASHTYVEPFTIQALDESSIGFAADIVLTLSAPGAAPATARVHAVIGLPDLQAPELPARTDVAPGTLISQQPVIANTGQVAATTSFSLMFTTSDTQTNREQPGFTPVGTRYSNCHYRQPAAVDFVCVFTQALAPGTAWTTDAPITYRTEPPLMVGDIQYLPALNDGYTSWRVGPGTSFPETGDGPALGLVPAAVPTDTTNTGYLKVTSTQSADFQAVGADLAGKPGDTAEISVGVRNAGPGVLGIAALGGFYEITLPAGVTLTSSAPCEPWTKPADTYHCITAGSLPVGGKSTVRLTVRLDRAVAGAVGEVKVIQPVDTDTGEVLTHDPDRANDVAPITVRVTGSGSTSGASGGGTDGGGTNGGATAGTGGSGGAGTPPPTTGAPAPGSAGGPSAGPGGSPDGSLAATGSGETWPLTAASAGALLLGTAVFLAARRRRV